MFSDEDVRELIQLLPSKDSSNSLPSLVVSSSGRGLLTLQHLEHEFETRVTEGSERVALSNLARTLDVDVDTVLRLVKAHPALVILNEDSRSIITKPERDSIQKTLVDGISTSVLSKTTFLRQHNVSVESVDILLADLQDEIIDVDGHLSSKTYDRSLADNISKKLGESVDETRSVDIDPQALPGSPPKWFVSRILDHLLKSSEMASKFFVSEESGKIRCVPIQVIQQKCDTTTADLQSGTLPYLQLDKFQEGGYSAIFPNANHAREHFVDLSGAEIVGAFVISEKWVSLFAAKSIQELEQVGLVDLSTEIEQTFPVTLRNHIRPKADQLITAGYDAETVQIGDILLTRAAYDSKRSTLLDHATSDATSQWEQLSSDPTKEAKFSLPNISTSIADDNSISKAMLKERTTEKALEERFWNKIAEFETENEAGFSAFWTEKAALRITIYHDGLSSVEDQKLKDQLTELFAQYVQKELIPDVLSKARSRGHVLSRKSRKNIQRLESALQADGLDVPAILNSVDKFSKKQSIPPADAPVLEAAKQTMMSDMVRRMQKQKKSDGPLLFLTLVVLLLARHSNGIVYATGKFAPKLLKQLKSGLDPEQYAALEKWKDAAKTGSLNAEDREEMKKMAEV